MKKPSHLLLSIVLGVTAISSAAYAQIASTDAGSGPKTRMEVKSELADFKRTHQYDGQSDQWVLKPEYVLPAGIKTRAQIKAERATFLKENYFDAADDVWKPKNPAKSELTRAEVKRDAAKFNMTHEFDEETESWVLRRGPKNN